MTSRANHPESLEQMVDWERGLIAGRIFADDNIYQQEAEKLFLRTWIFLAHEDQLRNYGDFLSTYIGADRILSRPPARRLDQGAAQCLPPPRHSPLSGGRRERKIFCLFFPRVDL